MTLTTHSFILWLFSAFELILVVITLARYQRAHSIYALAGMLTGIAVMSFAVGALPFVEQSIVRVHLGQVAFFSGVVTFVSLLSLAISFPLPTFGWQRQLPLISITPIAFFIPLIFFTGDFLESIDLVNGLVNVRVGKVFFIFLLWASIYFLLAVMILVRKLKFIQKYEEGKRIRLFLLALCFIVLLGLVNDFILPLVGRAHNPFIALEGGGILAFMFANIVLRK